MPVNDFMRRDAMNDVWRWVPPIQKELRHRVYYESVESKDLTLQIGDFVRIRDDTLLERFGILLKLWEYKGQKLARLKWFENVESIESKDHLPDSLKDELYITSADDEVAVHSVVGKIEVIGFEKYRSLPAPSLSGPSRTRASSKTPHLFFCRRGRNTRVNKYTNRAFEWESIWDGEDLHVFDKFIDERMTRGQARRQRLASPKEESSSDDESSGYDELAIHTPSKRKRKSPGVLATPPKRMVIHTPSSKGTPRRIVTKKPLEITPLPQRVYTELSKPASPHEIARARLHVSAVPDSLPCREEEYRRILTFLEDAILDGNGACFYISGTPGTGKTATVREAIQQLHLRVDHGELDDFKYIEINGMKIADPNQAYSLLWENLSGKRVAPAQACSLLENEFSHPSPRRMPCVVLMDELDQLVTRHQKVMYNFFNWPSLKHSHLIVLAVANTMDLPERTLSNKISSRLGLERMTFAGYTRDQLVKIIEARLKDVEKQGLVEKDAITFASAKIAAVSGDARRALDICRRAVEIAEQEQPVVPDTPTKVPRRARKEISKVTTKTIKRALEEATGSPMFRFLQQAPLIYKVFLAALLTRMRRSGVADNRMSDIILEAETLCRQSKLEELRLLCGNLGECGRMPGLSAATVNLAACGVLVVEGRSGERMSRVRLLVGDELVKSALHADEKVGGLV